MHCPFCQAEDTKVVDTRLANDGATVRRRRRCLECAERFTTFENAELHMPRVIKSNGLPVNFDEGKLRAGMMRALQKRPVTLDQVDQIVHNINTAIRLTGEREISSETIGQLVMDELKKVDKVAYIRFASVYRSFENLAEFGEEIARLGAQKDD